MALQLIETRWTTRSGALPGPWDIVEDSFCGSCLVFDKDPSGLFEVLIYVVNESNQDADVFFDDLKITHSSSSADFKVSQVNEYYPYGLHTDKSWRHEGYVDPGMMYQAAYAGYDSLTGYYDFLYRSYDPALGQFFAVDPMAGTQTGYSPYHANYNNPIMYVDPLGLAPDYWPRHDSNPSSGGGSPDPGNWVSVGLGNSFGGHGYGTDFTTNSYSNVPDWTFYQMKNEINSGAGFNLSLVMYC